MRKFLVVCVLAAVILAGWCFHKRLFQDDEKRIREIIHEMELAAEKKSADGLMDYFSRDYKDSSGNTRFVVYGMVKRTLQRVDELRVTVSDVSVTVAGDRAWADMEVVAEAVRDGEVSYPFGSDRDPETPSLTFKKTGTGDWKIIKVENVQGGGF